MMALRPWPSDIVISGHGIRLPSAHSANPTDLFGSRKTIASIDANSEERANNQ
jgi:hypothetical protein